MACIMARPVETSETTIGILVLLMNLEKRLRLLFDLFTHWILFQRKWAC
jgi:hypothetical protein